jgi:hypothetical protein
MATARRIAAVAGLCALAGLGHANVELTGVRLEASERDRILQQVSAERATMTEDRRMVVARGLTFFANASTTETITCKAPLALLPLTPPERATSVPIPLQVSEFRKYAREFDTMGRRGDVLLRGEGTTFRTVIGERGFLETSELLWSARHHRLYIPVPFRQEINRGTGRVSITGDALSVDQSFREWVYFAGDDEDMTMDIESAAGAVATEGGE